MGNTTGRLFRVALFGESHGPAIGCVVDGCPPRVAIGEKDVQVELDRRRPGGRLASGRAEPDSVEILSGVFEGLTLGTPIAMLIRNRDANDGDYAALKDVFRPSHADYTTWARYGVRDHRGGGRASARETAARVAAGAVAGAFLKQRLSVETVAYVSSVGEAACALPPESVRREDVDSSPVRCPDPDVSALMEAGIREAQAEGDSVGGVVTLVLHNLPAGLGDPVCDKFSADLAKAAMSIPAAVGFEMGAGFSLSAMRGSRANDLFAVRRGEIKTLSNRGGGVQGGITNGEPVVCRVAFRPTPSIAREQRTVDVGLNPVTVRVAGRHDPCVAPRAAAVVEAVARLVAADHLLRWVAIGGGKTHVRQSETPQEETDT